MGLIENIFGAVLLIGVVLAVTLIITLETSDNVNVDLVFKQQSFLEEKHQVSLNTVFTLTEPETGQRYDRLVARSLANRQEVIPVGQHTFNVTDNLRQRFNLVFGEGNWHYRVTPRVSTIAVAFVIDGTPSVVEQRELLEQEMESIIQSTTQQAQQAFGQDIALSFYIFIPTDDLSQCQAFTQLTVEHFESCEIVSQADMYDHPDFNYPRPIFTVDSFGNDFYSTTLAHRADWLGALVWGAWFITESTPQDAITLFIPLADELTTGSIPDECFEQNLGSTDPQDVRGNAVICAFCSDACPDRSQPQVVAAQGILEDLYDNLAPPLIRSIFIEECDVLYDDIWSSIPSGTSRTQYIDDIFGTARPGTGQTWCDMNDCLGCDTNPVDSTQICFRSVCWQDTQDQLQELNDAFGNEPLITISDLADLPTVVTDSIGAMIQRQIREDGRRDETQNRFAITYDLFVPGQEIIPFTLWVYEERGFDMTLPEVFSTPLPDLIEQDPNIGPIVPGGVDGAFSPEEELEVRIPAVDRVTDVQIVIDGVQYPLTREGDSFVVRIPLDAFPDGTYDIEIIYQDAQGNQHREVLEDVFSVDQELIPPPQVSSVTSPLSVGPNAQAEVVVEFDREVTAVTILIEGPGSVVQQSLADTLQFFAPGSQPLTQGATTRQWGVLLTPENPGVYTLTEITFTDVLQRTHTRPLQRDITVIDVQPCTSLDECQADEFCWGTSAQELNCQSNRAPDGSHTSEDSACQAGLVRDATGRCVHLDSTYSIAFVPVSYHLSPDQYRAFVDASIQWLRDYTPMRECTQEGFEREFSFHRSEDFACVRRPNEGGRHACQDTTRDMGGNVISMIFAQCYNSVEICAAESEFTDASRIIGLRPVGWPSGPTGTVLGFAAIGGHGLSSRQGELLTVQNTLLHEFGHMKSLEHLSLGVPLSDTSRCRSPNNRADCTNEQQEYIMNYMRPPTMEFGPAGYAHMAQELGNALERCRED